MDDLEKHYLIESKLHELAQHGDATYIVRCPFVAVDAALAHYLSSVLAMEMDLFRSRREPQSSGSARFMLFRNDKIIGAITARALDLDTTKLSIELSAQANAMPPHDQAFLRGVLIWVLQRFVSWLAQEQQDLLPRALDLQQSPAAGPAPQRIAVRLPPQPDPVEGWLDKYDAERARGRRITLRQIADESGYSESLLKKRHAARKRGNQNEPK